MSGFAGESKRRRGRDYEEFPELVEDLMRRFPKRSRMQNAPEAQADLHYLDTSAIAREIDRLKTAVKAVPGFRDCFLTAPSPGIISTTMFNAYYDSHESYLAALAREMSHEYRAIHEAGFILQIDSPDLAMDRAMFYRDLSDSAFVKAAEKHVAALNKAVEGIPRDRIRLHCCWGNWEGPHLHDVALETILPVLYQANVGALSIEFANPRHQHEYEAVRRIAAGEYGAHPGCDRFDHEICRTPRGSRAPCAGSSRGGRRPRARHCRRGLRLRHVHRARMGDRTGGVAEAESAPRGRRHCIGAAVGAENSGVRQAAPSLYPDNIDAYFVRV